MNQFRPALLTRLRQALAITAVAVFIAVAAPNAFAATTTESESNNTVATADVVALGDSVQGSTFSTTNGDEDYFAYDAPADGRITVDLDFPAGLGTARGYDVDIYDSSGANLYSFSIDANQNDGTDLAAQGTYLPAGRFYVRIYGYIAWSTWGQSYTLTTTHTPGLVETETNDSTARADVLTLGSTVTASSLTTTNGDEDYFAYDAPADGRITVDLDFPAGLGTARGYDVDIYDSSGANLYSFSIDANQNDGTDLAAQGTYLPAGRFYVRIYGYIAWSTWGQSYTLTTTHTPGLVETETNNSTARADVLPLGSTVTASSLTTTNGDEDYFAYDAPTAGPVTLKLTFPSGLGTGRAYDVDVYNAAGDPLYEYRVDTDQSDGASLAAQSLSVPGGRFYVRIYGYVAWSTWGESYALTVLGPGSFADVPSSNPFFADIEWMKAEGISTGTVLADGTSLYKPADPVSRMAMSAFLYRYSGDSYSPPANPSFADVPRDHPFYTEIEWMKAEGITTGTVQPDGPVLYKPNDAVSREAMSAFLYRMSGDTFTPPSTASFPDVPTTHYFYTPIEWMKSEGITTGSRQPDGTVLYLPREPVTREAMAAFLHRYDGR
ncbi:S-layer homology domain-containing protein [Microbacteriaceae bacterium VKM Ac-2855]|nr:S-layer homology domain-containing protein [Microbacteriaceae bacterium VKM Ac-2855]